MAPLTIGMSGTAAFGLTFGYGHNIANRVVDVRFAPIVLKKSFLGDEQNFLGPLMRLESDNVRDHIFSHKNDHGPSYRRYGPLLR
jgi:hypothetical protein